MADSGGANIAFDAAREAINRLQKDYDRLRAANAKLVEAATQALWMLNELNRDLGGALPCDDETFDPIVTKLRTALAVFKTRRHRNEVRKIPAG